MSKRFSLSLIPALAALSLTTPLAAQTRSAVGPADLDAAIIEQPAVAGAAEDVRGAIQGFLATDQGQDIADLMGVSVVDLSSHVAALDDASLSRIAGDAGVTELAYEGGPNTVVLGLTAVLVFLVIFLMAS